QLAGEQRPEVFDAAEVLEDVVQHAVHADPEGEPDDAEDEELAAAASGPLLADALQRGAPLRLEHVAQGRLLHRPSTSASSRASTPPVSLRNSSSKLASPAWCCRRRSATVPLGHSALPARPPDPLEQLADAALHDVAFLAVQPRDEPEEFRPGELVVDEGAVRDEAEPQLRRERALVHVVPAQEDPALAR